MVWNKRQLLLWRPRHNLLSIVQQHHRSLPSTNVNCNKDFLSDPSHRDVGNGSRGACFRTYEFLVRAWFKLRGWIYFVSRLQSSKCVQSQRRSNKDASIHSCGLSLGCMVFWEAGAFDVGHVRSLLGHIQRGPYWHFHFRKSSYCHRVYSRFSVFNFWFLRAPTLFDPSRMVPTYGRKEEVIMKGMSIRVGSYIVYRGPNMTLITLVKNMDISANFPPWGFLHNI